MPKTGDLNRRITIEQPDPNATAGGFGHVDLTDDANWTTYAERWAKKATTGSREFERARQTQAELAARFTLRFDNETKAITPEMRVIDEDGSTLPILGAYDPDGLKTDLVIDCKQPE